MSFGKQIQFFRKKNNLTQEQLSEELYVSRQAISKWESDKGYPEVDKIIYFCNKYHIPISDLFQDEINFESSNGNTLPIENNSLWHDIKNFYDNLTNEQRSLIKFIFIAFIIVFAFNLFYMFGANIGQLMYYVTH